MINKLKPKSEFSKNVLTLLTGTTIAQAIPIASSPILTRLYTPEDFGVYAIFIAITAIFGSIANARYELAIMLPKKDEDAINIFALGFLINVILSIFLLLIVLIFKENLIEKLNNKEIEFWLYFIPFSVFLVGCFNLLNFYNNRIKKYKDIANAKIIKSIALVIIQLSIGFFKSGAGGLVMGTIFANLFANVKLIKNIINDKSLLFSIKQIKIIALAKKYKNFPKFTMWATLANKSSVEVTSILISFVYSIGTLGFYSLVQRVLGVPTSLIGNSVGQVFFQEATKEKQLTGKATQTFKSTLKKLLLIGIPIYMILFFIIENVFAIVFGEEWRVAGQYAKALIPLFFIQFVISPLTLMLIIFEKNKIGLYWQIGLLLLQVSLLFFANYIKIDFVSYLYIVAIVISAYYIYILYIVSKFNNIRKD